MRVSIAPIARRAPVLAVASLTLVVGAAPLLAQGADHLDAPAAKADHRIDITDVYAFRADHDSTALVLNVDGLLTPTDSKTATFRANALYELKVDTNADGKADIAYRIRFGDPWTNRNGTMTQAYVVRRAHGPMADKNEWSGDVVATGNTTPDGARAKSNMLMGGGSSFAGVRDDPFFFDLPGFVAFKTRLLGGSTDLGYLLGGFTGADTFAGTNVLSIVLRVPNDKLGGTGHAIGVWGTTSIPMGPHWKQQDRMGRPAINTVFNGLALPLTSAADNAQKDAFNFAKPTTDRATTKGNVTAVLNAIGNVLTANSAPAYSAGEVDAIGNVLLPDELTLTLGSSAGFASGNSLGTLSLNGRRLGDDVIDAEFALLTNFVLTTGDGVNGNDAPFSNAFPYLASAH